MRGRVRLDHVSCMSTPVVLHLSSSTYSLQTIGLDTNLISRLHSPLPDPSRSWRALSQQQTRRLDQQHPTVLDSLFMSGRLRRERDRNYFPRPVIRPAIRDSDQMCATGKQGSWILVPKDLDAYMNTRRVSPETENWWECSIQRVRSVCGCTGSGIDINKPRCIREGSHISIKCSHA